MIGHIQGEVVFSDGTEAILVTNSGIGYQVYCQSVLVEGSKAALFISHVIKEASEDLYGFQTLREKKMFELLTSVKGVGPKSAFALCSCIGVDQIIEAVTFENKKILTQAPGVGAKAAAQMILDLSGKILKIKMYSNRRSKVTAVSTSDSESFSSDSSSEIFEAETAQVEENSIISDPTIMNDALMACKELGFKEEKIIPVARKILESNTITRPEQLIHLVLKEV